MEVDEPQTHTNIMRKMIISYFDCPSALWAIFVTGNYCSCTQDKILFSIFIKMYIDTYFFRKNRAEKNC
ncbi:unnamed protein product [Blepharisma stoltei]|uniref:Uncharacterized protein n=1 Tax=Blepharisma stoltei TaxID=1481888 RepID=A0AAU9J936_9CILI|nr:unnamed protein product [Blepharisma stoltei]